MTVDWRESPVAADYTVDELIRAGASAVFKDLSDVPSVVAAIRS